MGRNKTDFEATAYRVSVVSLVGNIMLSLIKLIAGVVAHSNAMISDAIHSASDVFSTIIVMIGIRISSKEADKEHPYGHERLECVSSMLLAMTLVIVGLSVGKKGVEAIIAIATGNAAQVMLPGTLALVAAIVSIVSKEAMYRYTAVNAKRINSSALMADAWHHRSDAFSSIGALIGIAGARMGFPILDPVASLVICVFIAKAAWDIFMDAVNKMVDHACSDETVEQLRQTVLEVPEVVKVDSLLTRMFGARIYVDVEISLDKNMTLQEAHDIAHRVHDKIEDEFEDVKHCMVHVNPAEEGQCSMTADNKGMHIS